MDATSSRRSKRFHAQPVRRRMGEGLREPPPRTPARNGERAAAHGEDADPPQESAPPREDRAG